MNGLSQARRGELPGLAGKALLSMHYLFYGGVHRDWQEGVRRCLPVLAESFQPDVVWATFGNATSWQIARDIAGESACPWVADLKDHWQSFIPAVLRRPLASRYGDAAAFTAFSDDHVSTIREWFRRPGQVVYSGIDPALYPEQALPAQTITLTGAVYDEVDLAVLIDGIEAAVREMEAAARQEVRFCYAGYDADMVRAQTTGLEKLITVDIREQQPLGAWLEVLSGAAVNCYVKSNRTFHHKIFDLAGAGNPVLTVPPETDEARNIAALAGVTLSGAVTAGEVAELVQAALSKSGADSPVDRSGAVMGTACRDTGRYPAIRHQGQGMKVAVAVHGRFHGFDLADQLRRKGCLAGVFTTYPGVRCAPVSASGGNSSGLSVAGADQAWPSAAWTAGTNGQFHFATVRTLAGRKSAA